MTEPRSNVGPLLVVVLKVGLGRISCSQKSAGIASTVSIPESLEPELEEDGDGDLLLTGGCLMHVDRYDMSYVISDSTPSATHLRLLVDASLS